MRRACVDENKETINTNKIGLTNHIGSEFAPPGLPSSVEIGPPPEMSNPGSTNRRLG